MSRFTKTDETFILNLTGIAPAPSYAHPDLYVLEAGDEITDASHVQIGDRAYRRDTREVFEFKPGREHPAWWLVNDAEAGIIQEVHPAAGVYGLESFYSVTRGPDE